MEITLPSYVRLCFSQVRYLPILLRDILWQEGLWEDLRQEVHLAAIEAERGELDEHETCLLAGRRIYAFLKAYGYRRVRRDGHRSFCKDRPFSSIAEDPELLEERLAGSTSITELVGEKPTKADFVRDHPQEAILAILRKTGEMSKRDLYTHLGLTTAELDQHCAPLIKRGLVIEVKRPNTIGRPRTPLLLAVKSGHELPMLSQVVDRDERIRHAYFQEGKGIKRIVREFHHSKRTVRKAIAAPGVFVR